MLALSLATACGGSDPLAGLACDPLVFASLRTGEWQLHVLSGGTTTQLTTSGPHLNPRWSPDGDRILFTTVDDGEHDLHTMAADGSDRRPLAVGATQDYSGDWSPDGARVVFDRDVGDRGYAQVFVLDVGDASSATQLTFGEPNAKPRWSPDGTTIAFLSWRDDDAEVYAMAPDGSGARNLTRSDAWDVLPAWSPDGSTIAFVSDRDGNPEIYLMQADGREPVRLTSNPAEDSNPTWTRDGRHVLFTSARPDPGIYAVAADGTGPPRWVAEGFVHDCGPVPAAQPAS